ncbi:AAA family ATPase [Listeria rocourtiae]|uniref:AAA family ATPase n=1 Tax=Listeria rocourtiae TaxID=647910 RepID=UPI003D2F68C7
MVRIHVMGASGVGTSTLGRALANRLGVPFFDTDDYYWEEKYNVKREIEARLEMMEQDFAEHHDWILSGALSNWGTSLERLFDVVVFLEVPRDVRLGRLVNREQMRYGDAILPGGSRYEAHLEFVAWASRYEDGGLDVRSKKLHEAWFQKLNCPVLRVTGDRTVDEEVTQVLTVLNLK